MKIKLFSEDGVLSEYIRMNSYVRQRKFTLGVEEDLLKERLKVIPPKFNSFKEKILSEITAKKVYCNYCGSVGIDNKFELELLGCEKYSKKFIYLLDLSNSFDLVMHLLTGCSVSAVRGIPDYSRVSKSFLLCDEETVVDVDFSSLFGLDSKIEEYFSKLYDKVKLMYSGLSCDELLERFVVVFHNDVLNLVDSIIAYIMCYLSREDSDFVFKSKRLSLAVGTSTSNGINDLLVELDGVQYPVALKIYEKLGYLEELVR